MDWPTRGHPIVQPGKGEKPPALIRAEVAFLSRVLDGRVVSAPAVGIAALLHRTDGVGDMDAGGRLHYSPASNVRARVALVKRVAVAPEAPGQPRAELRALPVRAPNAREDLVAGFALGSWAGMPLPYAYALFEAADLLDASVDLWIVCDEIAQLKTLQSLDWLVQDLQGLRVLAIHRGVRHRLYKPQAVMELIRKSTAPVWAYGEPAFKPLLRAAALPRLDRYCLPPVPQETTRQVGARRSLHLPSDIRKWTEKVEATGCQAAIEAWRRIAEEHLR